MKQYRQGDILFIRCPISEARGKPVQREEGRLVIARGEATGHAHVVTHPAVRMIEGTRSRYLVSDQAFEVTHEEHAAVKLPSGTFRIVRQAEYTPQAIRRVSD